MKTALRQLVASKSILVANEDSMQQLSCLLLAYLATRGPSRDAHLRPVCDKEAIARVLKSFLLKTVVPGQLQTYEPFKCLVAKQDTRKAFSCVRSMLCAHIERLTKVRDGQQESNNAVKDWLCKKGLNRARDICRVLNLMFTPARRTTPT